MTSAGYTIWVVVSQRWVLWIFPQYSPGIPRQAVAQPDGKGLYGRLRLNLHDLAEYSACYEWHSPSIISIKLSKPQGWLLSADHRHTKTHPAGMLSSCAGGASSVYRYILYRTGIALRPQYRCCRSEFDSTCINVPVLGGWIRSAKGDTARVSHTRGKESLTRNVNVVSLGLADLV